MSNPTLKFGLKQPKDNTTLWHRMGTSLQHTPDGYVLLRDGIKIASIVDCADPVAWAEQQHASAMIEQRAMRIQQKGKEALERLNAIPQ
jgi:hypothetical protein